MGKVNEMSKNKENGQSRRELRVVLNRVNDPSNIFYRKSHSLSESRSSTVSSVRSIDKRRELFVRIRPLDIQNVITSITASNYPIYHSLETFQFNVPTPTSTSTLPSPRHASVSRLGTYRKGLDISPEELENLSNNSFHCGPFNDLCRQCGAKFFAREPKNDAGIRLMCCKNGKISIPIPDCPPELKRLYTENSETSNEFLTNIRAANSYLAMGLFKTSPPTEHSRAERRWCFTTCGQIYSYAEGHPNSQEPHYYFLDIDELLKRRIDLLGSRVDQETFQLLETILRRHNPYIRAFKNVGEVFREEADRRDERPVIDVIIALSRMGDSNIRRRQYDLLQSREIIAGVFFGTEPYFNADLKLYPHDNIMEPHNEIISLQAMSDPMIYPLLFPLGEEGYVSGTRYGDHRVTMLEFYRFRIQCRDASPLLHNGAKLFQQYLVNAWVRVQAITSWWIQHQTERFRFAAHEVVRKTVAQNPANLNRIGRAVVLPTDFSAGSCDMQRQYLDAMAVVARHGKPDLLITFECNREWPEMEDILEYPQKAQNRPDLVCRVFYTKLLEFLDDVINKKIFGTVLSYHYVIDFLKFGLPRARIVVTFSPEDKILTSEQVDKIISARIPDRKLQPQLYKLVARHQVHGTCVSFNPNASCMDGGQCRQFFPKQYSEMTILNAAESQRPVYKRPRDNRSIYHPAYTITNELIVPYNPYTLAKFQTHVNFEVVGSLHTLKHLYKYVTRAIDCVTIYENKTPHLRFPIDDVPNYLDCRCVTSMEAAWCLLGFKLYDSSHSVVVLPVHLPGEQYVVFGENDKLEDLQTRLARRTKLEAWFLLNAENLDARQFSYSQIPEHFIWENSEAKWVHRQPTSKMIGCLADVTPEQNSLELRYLRILLRHVRGATSFESLRTVNGVVWKTFKETCDALNLLSRSEEYDHCLKEAALMRRPHQMRHLFGLIICSLTDEALGQVPLLWRHHRDSMIQDYISRGLDRRTSLASCIEDINKILQINRAELQCCALGIIIHECEKYNHETNEAQIEADVEDRVEGDNARRFQYCLNSLNIEQRRIFLRIVHAVCRLAGKYFPRDLHELVNERVVSPPGENLFFIDGAGGTGKTFLLNTLVSYVSETLKIPVVAVSWTDLGANLLVGGTTVTKSFRLPLNLKKTSTVGWHLESYESQFFKNVGLIVWDEAPATPRYAVEAIDRYLRDITGFRISCMGDKCSVFAGDFRQVSPLIPHIHRASIIDASLKRLHFWKQFRELKLTVNVRVARHEAMKGGLQGQRLEELGNRTFKEWLLALGEGRLPYVSFECLKLVPADVIEIPPLFYSPTLMDLIFFVYSKDHASKDIGERAILCPTNEAIDNVNQTMFELLPGFVRTYTSFNECKIQSEDQFQIPQDVLNSVGIPELPPHELKLKVGAIVMLLCNLDVESGECRGARMRVTGLGEHLIQCQMVSEINRGRTLWIPRIKMTARDPVLHQEVIRTQFPVRLAYAIAINDSQGQTLKKAGVYLERSCFLHGQLYMAFSRVESPRNIRVCVKDGLKQGSFGHKEGKKFTRNVVYHSLLGYSAFKPERRQMISRSDTANQTELEQMFCGDTTESEVFENIDVTQMLQNFEQFVSNVETAELHSNPYLDDSETDIPSEFALPRVATVDRASTSAMDLTKPSTSGLQSSCD